MEFTRVAVEAIRQSGVSKWRTGTANVGWGREPAVIRRILYVITRGSSAENQRRSDRLSSASVHGERFKGGCYCDCDALDILSRFGQNAWDASASRSGADGEAPGRESDPVILHLRLGSNGCAPRWAVRGIFITWRRAGGEGSLRTNHAGV